jgi:hypothetical protein
MHDRVAVAAELLERVEEMFLAVDRDTFADLERRRQRVRPGDLLEVLMSRRRANLVE